jgi:hypothetical protein
MINYAKFLRIMESKEQITVVPSVSEIDATKAIDAFQKRISAKAR